MLGLACNKALLKGNSMKYLSILALILSLFTTNSFGAASQQLKIKDKSKIKTTLQSDYEDNEDFESSPRKNSSRFFLYAGGVIVTTIGAFFLYNYAYKQGLLDTLDAVHEYNEITPRTDLYGVTGYITKNKENPQSWQYHARWPEKGYRDGGIAVINDSSSTLMFRRNPWVSLR